MKITQDKSALYSFIFATIVLSLILTKGHAIEALMMFYKQGFMFDLWIGIIGVSSVFSGWCYLFYRVFIKPNLK